MSEARACAECNHASEHTEAVYVAEADIGDWSELPPDANEHGAYLAVEVYGDMCKLVEGLDRQPHEGEHVEIRMCEAHTRRAVIDRSDNLLTPEEVKENAAAVTQAVIAELKTWQGFISASVEGQEARRPASSMPSGCTSGNMCKENEPFVQDFA